MLNLLFGPPGRLAATSNTLLGRGWVTNRVRTRAGAYVDEETALNYAAVWRATRILDEAISGMPLCMYKRDGDDRREQSMDYRYKLMKYKPNPKMGAMAFRGGRTAHQVNWGSGFGEIEWDSPRMREILALWPIHPSRVRPNWNQQEAEQYPYLVRNNDGSFMAMQANEMLHVPGANSDDGIWGKGVIAHARESIGFGIATERHGATQFGSGNLPKAAITGQGAKFRNKQEKDEFRQEWKEIHGSSDSGEIAILPVDVKLEKLSFSNEDAQFLQTRKHNRTEIANWYGLYPHMLGETDQNSRASVEQFSIELVAFSLLPWAKRWEEQLALKLLTEEEQDEGYYFEHNFGGLLRGDMAARISFYRMAIMIGLMTINECRRLENLNGIGEAGDINYVPSNMTTAERMMTGEAPPGAGEPGSDQNGAPNDGMPSGMAPGMPPEKAEYPVWISRAVRKEIKQHLLTMERQGMQVEAPAPPNVASVEPPARAAEVARVVLADALGRWLTKEANAVARAAHRADFEDWLVAFHAEQRPTLEAMLGPAALALDRPAAELAEKVLADSRADLLDAYGHDNRPQFAERLQAWSGRAAGLAEALLTEKEADDA